MLHIKIEEETMTKTLYDSEICPFFMYGNCKATDKCAIGGGCNRA